MTDPQPPPAKRARETTSDDPIDLTGAESDVRKEVLALIDRSASEVGLARIWEIEAGLSGLLPRCAAAGVDAEELLERILTVNRETLEGEGAGGDDFFVVSRLFKFIADQTREVRARADETTTRNDPVTAYMRMIGDRVPKTKVLKMFAECGMRLDRAVENAEALTLERAIRHSDADIVKYVLETAADPRRVVTPRIWNVVIEISCERVRLRDFITPELYRKNTTIYYALEPHHIVNNILRSPVGGGVPTEEAMRDGIACRSCYETMRPECMTYKLPCGHNETCSMCFMMWNPRHTCPTCRAGYVASTSRFVAKPDA